MALAGTGLLLDFSLERLPLRVVMGSLLVLAGGRLLLRRDEEIAPRREAEAPAANRGGAREPQVLPPLR